jgi:glycosyltransferase involved in cell wall biosynthesis
LASPNIILGIDASNIRAGGGLTHLVELLAHTRPEDHGFSEVMVWASSLTLSKMPDLPWLTKRSHPFLNRSFFFRVIWQKFFLARSARKSCDILFLPSGNTSGFNPYVSICQNLLPFESKEKASFGISLVRLRYELLKWNQCKSFRKADGVVFLSDYSLKLIGQVCGKLKNQKVIPHGVSEIFKVEETDLKPDDPCINILYVSIINFYKHQDKLVKAIYKLLDLGYDIKLTLIGPSYLPALKALEKVINNRPEYRNRIVIYDKVPYENLPEYYRDSNIFVFASSCETFGMIILEAMACGSAIACSNLSSMKEVAGDAAIYFNPHEIEEIAEALQKYLKDPELRRRMSNKAISRASAFTWEKCSKETLTYLSNIYGRYSSN